MTSARARLSGGVVVFTLPDDEAWTRAWSPFSRRELTGPGTFDVPGLASVNSPFYDWSFIAQSLPRNLRPHPVFHVDGYDGDANGLRRFFDFTCSVRASFVLCTNALGDAMRYKPPRR